MADGMRRSGDSPRGLQKPISRRALLARGGTAAIGLTLGGGLLGACGGDTARPSTTTTPQATPTPGDTLAVGDTLSGVIYGDLLPTLPRGGAIDISFFQEPPTLDILVNTLGAISIAADPAHDFLERYDHNGALTVSLAERLEFVNPTTYRYTLRKAKFHNGRAVVAEDVKNTVDYIKDPKVGSVRAAVFEDVTVKVIDDRTLEVKLARPDRGLRHHLPRMPIIPIEEKGKLAERPVGCGPFRFKEWVKNSHVSHERNPDYWNPDAPRVDSLRYSFRADQPAAAQAFLAGENDFLYAVSSAFVPRFLELPESQMRTVKTVGGFSFIGFNNKATPFDDPAVRRAWERAIDRQAMARASSSLSTPVSTGPLAPGNPLYPADLDRPRDVEQAKSLLTGKSNLDTKVMVIDEATEAIGQVLKSNLAEAGVEIELERVDVATYVDRRVSGNYTAVISGWFTHVEPGVVLDVLFQTDAPSNYWNYSNPRVDRLLARGRGEFDTEKRKQLYHDVMRTAFVEDAGMIAVCTETFLHGYRPYTNGHQYRPDPNALFHNPIISRQS
jgi:peptide/nickel transport system substrate-binding protein